MIIELLKHPLEAGILIALAVYGLILVWTLMAHLKWLPRAVARPVRRLLNRLGRLPVLGRAVTATRRHPLSLGLVTAILVGITVPTLLISVYVLFSAIFVGVIMVLAFRYGDFTEEEDHFCQEDIIYGDPVDPRSYDEEWMRARGKLPRPG